MTRAEEYRRRNEYVGGEHPWQKGPKAYYYSPEYIDYLRSINASYADRTAAENEAMRKTWEHATAPPEVNRLLNAMVQHSGPLTPDNNDGPYVGHWSGGDKDNYWSLWPDVWGGLHYYGPGNVQYFGRYDPSLGKLGPPEFAPGVDASNRPARDVRLEAQSPDIGSLRARKARGETLTPDEEWAIANTLAVGTVPPPYQPSRMDAIQDSLRFTPYLPRTQLS